MDFSKLLAIFSSNVTLDLYISHPRYICCAFCSLLLLPMIRHMILASLALGSYEPECLVQDISEHPVPGGPVFSPVSVFLIFLSVFWSYVGARHAMMVSPVFSLAILLISFYYSEMFWPLKLTVDIQSCLTSLAYYFVKVKINLSLKRQRLVLAVCVWVSVGSWLHNTYWHKI